MDQIQFAMQSKIGMLYLIASGQGLEGVFWRKSAIPLTARLDPQNPAEKSLLKASTQLNEYFEGERKTFDLELSPAGTLFQKQVWKALLNIPFGKTASYMDIAKAIHKPKAMRAVGNANGKNPFCVIIPCHRVIAADDSLGGYTGGIEIKKRLLALEGHEF